MIFQSLLALSCFVLTLISVRLLILTARKRALARAPELFQPPLPRGGVAVVFSLIIYLAVFDLSFAIILSLLLLTAIEMLDEMIDIALPIRLLVQLMAVLAGLSVFPQAIFSDMLPAWLDKSIAGALWIGGTNLFSRMDRMDGIAATGMTCLAAGLCLVTTFLGLFPNALSSYALVVAAAGAGFAWWSWPKAKARLGLAGNIPIGFLLGYLLLLAISKGQIYAAAILPAYFVSDGVMTTLRQWRRKSAHPDFYFQMALRGGRSPESTLRMILGMHLLLIFLAANAALDPKLAVYNLALAYFSCLILLGFLAHTQPKQREAA